jgi:hypothetical protein
MSTTKAFDSYDMQINGGNSGRVALILCYQAGGFVGRIDFYPDNEALPSDFLWHPANPTVTYIVLSMPVSRFDVVANTLRQEKPLRLFIDVDAGSGALTDGNGYLATAQHEPIGELAG